MRKWLFFYCLFFFFSVELWATHNRAGEITYRALDTNNVPCLKYEITVTLYSKCESQADRCFIELDFGDGTKGEFPRVNGPRGSGVQDNCGHSCPGGEAVGESITMETKKSIFKGIHSYVGPGVWTISMEDPNRNAGILNLGGGGSLSVNIPFFIQTKLIIDPFLGTNNSPVLLYPPIDNACANQCFYHNPAAFDKDGDSLSYHLDTCRTSNGKAIPGFVQPNVFGGGNLTMDVFRGNFTWCAPQLIGQYNAAFLIREWRKLKIGGKIKYYMIGEIERDLQIDVAPCSNNPPVIDPLNDTCIVAGSTLTFSVRATDINKDIIKLSALGGPLSPFIKSPVATFNSVTGAEVVSGTFNWQTACNHVRQQPYLLTFKAVDNDPKVPLSDIKTIAIKVIGPAPTGLTANPSGIAMELSWNPSVCGEVVGYEIYRKSDCNPWIPAPCQTGVSPGSGYKLIGKTNALNATSFRDDNNGQGLVQGVSYSYIVVALFPDGSKSYASVQACGKLLRDTPVITNVDVLTTSTVNGKIMLKWLKPLAGPLDFDTTKPGNQGPYELRIMRAEGFSPASGGFSQVTSFSSPWFAALTVNTLDDSLLNTADKAYSYRIDFYCNNVLHGYTQTASSVYLTTKPFDNRVELTWQEQVPWTNYNYYIYQEMPSGSRNFLLIDSTSGKRYVVDSLVNGKQYCFKVRSIGAYSDVSLPRPLYNFSEEKCDTPVDREAPCPPRLMVNADCINSKNFLTWENQDNVCADDVIQYKLYYKSVNDEPFRLIATIDGRGNVTHTDSPQLENISTVIGCYAVTAIDTFFNESVISNVVCIDTCQVYELPNIFSPDNNGINDTYIPLPYKYVKSIDMKIYNRWGNLVFETRNPDIKWDGKNSLTGLMCSEGTYYYVCTANLLSIKGIIKKELKGFIQLSLPETTFQK